MSPFREQASPGTSAYRRAVRATDELVERMREAESSTDPARSLMATIWLQRHNVPFIATVHESVQEVAAPLDQDPHAARSPRPSAE